MNQDQGSQNAIDLALGILSRRKWLALTIFLAVLIGGMAVAKALPKMYQSVATVLIERQKIPDELVRSTVTGTLEMRLQTITQSILSRSRLEDLVLKFDLYPEMRTRAPMEQVTKRLREEIILAFQQTQAQRGRETVAFSLTYAGRDPETVANVLNTLASYYSEENLKVRGEQAEGTSQFLSAQLEGMKRDLEEQERRLTQFKERHIGELPHQQETNLTSLENLSTRLQMNMDTRTQSEERRASLIRQLAEAQGMESDSPAATATRLTELKQELADLESKFSDKYPDVVRVKKEIEALETKFAETNETEAEPEPSVADSPYIRQLKDDIDEETSRLNSINAERQRLLQSVETYQKRVENAPRVEQEYQFLNRDYEATQELYASMLERSNDANLAEEMEMLQKGEQFRLLEPALASKQPAAPNRPMLYGIAFGLALGCAIGVAFLADQLDNSFHTLEQLREATDLPVLGSIPFIDTSEDKMKRSRRFAYASAFVTLGLVVIAFVSYKFGEGNTALSSLLLR